MTRIKLVVNVFPGVQNLPHYAALEHGFFAARGLDIELRYTQSSEEQRKGLAAGDCDIAHAALDNAVAMIDVAGEDISIVVGLDPSFNKFVVQDEIKTYSDLRGKTLGVDAPDTAFALIAYEILARNGLPPGSYHVQPIGATRFRLNALQERRIDAAMLNLPFNLMARDSGLRLLDDPLSIIGPYQSVGGFVRRAWAEQNKAVLSDYLASYIEGVRWVLDSAHHAEGTKLLSREMKLEEAMAAECVAALTRPKGGIAVDARLDDAGMANMLNLRARFMKQESAAPISRYYDPQFYESALETLARVDRLR